MCIRDSNIWVESQPEDIIDIEKSPIIQSYLLFKIADYNNIIGFIGYEKKNRYLVFKTKLLSSTRDTGARCDESGKSKIITKLNDIIGEVKYTSENTKTSIVIELCIIQEFILRFYNSTKRNNKKWLLIPEIALLYKLYTISV